MTKCDVVVIGGGIAGLSAADALADHAELVLLEREEAVGFHASGRSATFSHFGIGDAAVRAMTRYSLDILPDYDLPEDGVRVSRRWPAMFTATEAMLPGMAALESVIRPLAPQLRRIDADEARAIVPVLRTGPDHVVGALLDPDARKLDSDALLQHHVRGVAAKGGRVVCGAGVTAIAHGVEGWTVETANGAFQAKTVVNAAGAWADTLAAMAGVTPLGLRPLRRTIIAIDPPANVDSSGWPFTKTVEDGFYMLPDAGRLLVSPMDEVPSDPVDAQPEEYEVALAAWALEQGTTIAVRTIPHKWAGLRTFTPDRVPTAGFDRAAPGFFWLAGQGGYGLQTSPAMARIAASLICGTPWPAIDMTAEMLSPLKYAA